MTEKYQLENPNAHYLANLSNLNLTNNQTQIGRLPTLGEILSNKTKSPINLHTFYLYMKHVEGDEHYLDFWFDLINHLNLCKHYVRGLRDSIIRQSGNPTGNANQRSSFASNNPFNATPPLDTYRDSVAFSDKSKHKSLSLSMLLDMIINDQILEDNDSNRLSEFLRGDINLNVVDPKLKELIETYNADEPVTQPSPIIDAPFSGFGEKRISSNSKLLEDSPDSAKQANELKSPKRRSSLNPSFVEKLLHNSTAGSVNLFISRQNLRDSSHNLLLKYFVDDSEKHLNLPTKINRFIINAIEVDGRDDPDVFNSVKRYIFNRLENEHMPNFLNFVAIKNVNHTINSRMIVGFFFAFISFWIAFSLIFLKKHKRYRLVVIVTFFATFYCLLSAAYRIDPFLALCRRSESFIPGKIFIKLDDSFIYKLLLKRSAWVMVLIILSTAIFSVIFCLVPGYRL